MFLDLVTGKNAVKFLSLSVAAILLSVSADAAVKLPAVFADGMVLQHELKTPVWGTSDPGDKITVKVGEYTAFATADDKGEWKTTLDDMKATSTPLVMTVTGKNTVTFKNVLIGDVWIASGHSNMYWGTLTLNEDYPLIRVYRCPRDLKSEQGDWIPLARRARHKLPLPPVPGYFVRHIHRYTKIPIGVIYGVHGMSYVDHWKVGDSCFKKYLQPVVPYGVKGAIKIYDGGPDLIQSRKLIDGWRKAWGQDIAFVYAPYFLNITARKDEEPDPVVGQRLQFHNHYLDAEGGILGLFKIPNVTYAAMFDMSTTDGKICHFSHKHPVGQRLALAAEGLLYGRKEGHLGPVYDSMTLEGNKVRLKFQNVGPGLMARSYHRPQMSQGLPILDFKIAGEDGKWIEPKERKDGSYPEEKGFSYWLYWPRLKIPTQVKYANAPYGLKTGFTVEEFSDALLGRRAKDRVKPDVKVIRVTFSRAEEHSKEVMEEHAKEGLRGFTIAGEDKRWIRANAKIEGDTLVAWNDRIKEPAAVRYGWASYGYGNLYNKWELPSPRFRTDNWDKSELYLRGRFGLRPGPVFKEHMVLQSGMKTPVWGVAEPGDKITVTLGEHRASVVADDKGKWLVRIGPMRPGGPHELVISDPYDTFTFRNVMVGDVWVIAGHWNVQQPVEKRPQDYSDDHPDLRLFRTRLVVGGWGRPYEGIWAPDQYDPRRYDVGNQSSVKERTRLTFSGVGYWFGRKLQEKNEVPIGVIAITSGKRSKLTLSDWVPSSAYDTSETIKEFISKDPAGRKRLHKMSRHPFYFGPIVPFGAKGIIWFGSSPAEEANAFLAAAAEQWGKDFGSPAKSLRILLVQGGDDAVRKAREAVKGALPGVTLVEAKDLLDAKGDLPKKNDTQQKLAERLIEAVAE